MRVCLHSWLKNPALLMTIEPLGAESINKTTSAAAEPDKFFLDKDR